MPKKTIFLLHITSGCSRIVAFSTSTKAVKAALTRFPDAKQSGSIFYTMRNDRMLELAHIESTILN